MKNKKILTILGAMLIIASVCCSGCGITGVNTSGSDESSHVSSSEGATDGELKTYTYTENVDTDVETPYTNIYTLTLLNDTEAKFEQQSVYSEDYSCVTSYTGTYKEENGNITFTYENPGTSEEDAWSSSYVFYLENDEVSRVAYATDDFSQIAGDYVCTDETYGSMTLSITQDGSSTLKMNDSGKEYTGSIMKIDERLDLMVSYTDETADAESEEAYDSIDWYINLGNGDFTYESYTTASYGPYAGTYTASGQLGDITFVLNEEGNASADVPCQDGIIPMAGSFYADSETGEISIYLSTDDSYGLSVTLNNTDGVYQYYGTITYPLYLQ